MKYNVGSDGKFNAICYNVIPGYGTYIYKEYSTKEKLNKALKEIEKWSDIKKAKEFEITVSQAHYGFITALSFTPSKLPIRSIEELEETTYHFEQEPWKMKDEEWEKEENKKKLQESEKNIPA